MKHEFVNTNGIRMHYVTEGQGPLVVLLHGFPQFWYTWRKVIPLLSGNYTVVAPDLRGYGESDKPENILDYSLNVMSEDIVGLIKSLGHEKAHIVGHDWGGAIAWDLAINHPEIVDHVVPINAPHPYKFAKAIKSDFKQIRKSWYIFFAQIPKLPEYIIGSKTEKFLKGIFKGQAINREAFSREDIAAYVKEYEKPGAIQSSMHYYRAAFKDRNKKITKVQIKAPTLLIWGEEDKALRKELTFEMDSLFSGPFQIEYLQNCSHWVVDEKPEKVANLIQSFLKS